MNAQSKASRQLPFFFSPAPDEAREALRRGKISERAYTILSWVLRQRRAAGHVPASACTKERIREAHYQEGDGLRGWSLRNIQRELADLKRAGFIAHVPEPSDPTGLRIVFPFLTPASARLRLVHPEHIPTSPPSGNGGAEFVSPPPPPGETKSAPPESRVCLPPRLLEAHARETGSGDRNNVNVGCAEEIHPTTPQLAEPPTPEKPATDDALESWAPDQLQAEIADLDEKLTRAKGSLATTYRCRRALCQCVLRERSAAGVIPPAVAVHSRPAFDRSAPLAPTPAPPLGQAVDFDAVMRRLRPETGFGTDAIDDAARRISRRLDDEHSTAAWRKRCAEVKGGTLPLAVLRRAVKRGCSGTATNPGAVAAAYIIEWKRNNMQK